MSWEYFFEVRCCFRHPTGYFKYFADDVCVEPDSFAHFVAGLRNIQQGTAEVAALKSVGEMLVFQLDQRGRDLDLRLSIRESLPTGKLAEFNVACEADFDLFVNKLSQEVTEFLSELRKA